MCRGGMAEPIEASQCVDLDRTIEIVTIYVYVVLYGSKGDGSFLYSRNQTDN